MSLMNSSDYILAAFLGAALYAISILQASNSNKNRAESGAHYGAAASAFALIIFSSVLAFIHALENRGMPQYSENITGLADDHDELMRLMRDLRNATPRDIRSGLPTDEQTSKFPRTEV